MNYKLIYIYLSIYLLYFSSSTFYLKAQNNSVCENAIPLCFQNNEFVYSNNVNNTNIGQIACLGTTPNPSWNFLEVDNSGTISMQIKQTNNSGGLIDLDFVLWGPYSSIEVACDNLDIGCPTTQDCPNNTSNSTFYPYGNIMSCSYSPSSIENFTIPNALSGEIYVLLTTNYSGQQGEIIITQSNSNSTNAGSIYTDLNIDLGPDQNLCDDIVSTTLNAYSAGVDSYEWFKDGFFLSSENSAELIVTESGNYMVLAFNNTCNTVGQDNINVAFIDCNNNGLINVSSFLDQNNNSIFDTNESVFNNGYFTYELNSDGLVNYVTSSTGNFTIVSDDQNNYFDISYYLYDDYQNCYTIPTVQFSNISVMNGDELTIDFPVTEQQTCEDVGVYLSSNQSPVPGFDIINYLTIKNHGILPVSGTIEFNLDEDLILNSASNVDQNYTLTPNSNGFILDFVNLQPGNVSNINISINCPTNLVLGDAITNSVEYVTASNDVVSDNNFYSITENIVGSYDPNNIMETNGPEIVFDDFITTDEFLYYTIRFQNLGTAEAINVLIENTLDPLLDETTLQMLDSSHDVVLRKVNNQLTFDFKNINLPAEIQNVEESKGFIIYKIKPISGYNISTVIPNIAEIYFDFNEAVVTNTFTTTFIASELSVDEFESHQFKMYPNPANTDVTISFSRALKESFDLTIIDIQGKKVLSTRVSTDDKNTFNINNLESGLYFVEIKNYSYKQIQKLIVN